MLSLNEITKKDITLNISATSWENAIKKSSEKLLENNDITENYIDSMINNVKKFGPYIVMTKNVALGHARPEDGANKTTLHFATLKPSINFGSKENDPVKLLIILAAKNENEHIKLLADLSRLIINPSIIEKLIASEEKTEFIEIVKKNLN